MEEVACLKFLRIWKWEAGGESRRAAEEGWGPAEGGRRPAEEGTSSPMVPVTLTLRIISLK